MDIEQKQADLIEQFVKQASSLHGSALAPLVADATSHPSLFAFSEILSVPSVLQVRLYALWIWWNWQWKLMVFIYLLLFDLLYEIEKFIIRLRKEGILKCFYVGKLFMGKK